MLMLVLPLVLVLVLLVLCLLLVLLCRREDEWLLRTGEGGGESQAESQVYTSVSDGRSDGRSVGTHYTRRTQGKMCVYVRGEVKNWGVGREAQMARLAGACAAAGLARGSTRGLGSARGFGCEPWAAPLGHARGASPGTGSELYTVWARKVVCERGAHALGD